MPFKSKAQAGWMFSNKPGMAKRWAKETPKGDLPEYVGDKKDVFARKKKKKGMKDILS